MAYQPKPYGPRRRNIPALDSMLTDRKPASAPERNMQVQHVTRANRPHMNSRARFGQQATRALREAYETVSFEWGVGRERMMRKAKKIVSNAVRKGGKYAGKGLMSHQGVLPLAAVNPDTIRLAKASAAARQEGPGSGTIIEGGKKRSYR